ncbi:unnamed protein product [Closterium sp. NIES-54]
MRYSNTEQRIRSPKLLSGRHPRPQVLVSGFFFRLAPPPILPPVPPPTILPTTLLPESLLYTSPTTPSSPSFSFKPYSYPSPRKIPWPFFPAQPPSPYPSLVSPSPAPFPISPSVPPGPSHRMHLTSTVYLCTIPLATCVPSQHIPPVASLPTCHSPVSKHTVSATPLPPS